MADKIDFTNNADLRFDSKLDLPPINMSLVGRDDYPKEPLSLLSITAEQPRKEVSLPSLEAKNTNWATDSFSKIYQDGVFKVLSNSAGNSHIGLKFLESPAPDDKRLRGIMGSQKEKLEDKFSLSVQLQIKF